MNEVAIAFYLEGVIEYEHNYRPDYLEGCELDIYIDSIKTAIEYDGAYRHKNRHQQELFKDTVCKEKGIELIRVREYGLPNLVDSKIIWVDGQNDDSINDAIKKVLTMIANKANVSIPESVDVDRDGQKIRSMRFINEVNNSFAFLHPELVPEWSDKNEVEPKAVAAHDNYSYWWKCQTCGNEWRASASTRSKGIGCPYCSGKKVKPGFNDLATLHPEFIEEWSDTNKLKPNMVRPGTHKKVWWKCKTCGNEWEAEVKSRVLQGNGCPYCDNKKIAPGFNDLESKNPELAKEWDIDKNNGCTPKEVSPSSG